MKIKDKYIKPVGEVIQRDNGAVSRVIGHTKCPSCKENLEHREVIHPSPRQAKNKYYWSEFYRCRCGFNDNQGKKIFNRAKLVDYKRVLPDFLGSEKV